jgi:hypothetical protein
MENTGPQKQGDKENITFTCPRKIREGLHCSAIKKEGPSTNCQKSLPIKEAERNKMITGFIWYVIKLP